MGYGDGSGWDMHDDMGWIGWLTMSSVLLGCLAVVGVLIYLVMGQPMPSTGAFDSSPARPRSAAQLLLDERFARGEIDQEEYEQRNRGLRNG